MSRGSIGIGIGGWTYPLWRGRVCPPDLPPSINGAKEKAPPAALALQ